VRNRLVNVSIAAILGTANFLILIGLPATAAAMDETAPTRPWTILVYGAVDNNADGPLIGFLNKLRRAIDDDPGLDLLLFIDRSEKHSKEATYLGEPFSGTRLYRLKRNSVDRLSGGDEFPQITTDREAELNSADAANLGRFIAWGKKQAPARHYALLIYSHANGWVMCPDETESTRMGIAELTDTVVAQERVDFLALELCSMGGIEVAYQWRPGNGCFEADVLVAIPNSGPPLDWQRAFARIRTPRHQTEIAPAVDPATMTSADFGRLVIEEGYRGRKAAALYSKNALNESAGCYDLRNAGAVKKSIDVLSVELAKAGVKNIFLELCRRESDGPIRYKPDGSNLDLYDLCRRISASDRFSASVREAAKEVMAAVEGFMIASFGMTNYKGFEAGKNGVYIVFPYGSDSDWKQFRWYTPLPGSGRDYGRWAFLKDGATPGNGVVENWFELLVSWLDEPNGADGIRGYRP
jgi:clostripain